MIESVNQKFDQSAFEKLEQTLELLPSLDTRTVCRHTLIKGESLGHWNDYARLDNIADPDFIEAKGYIYVGIRNQIILLKICLLMTR